MIFLHKSHGFLKNPTNVGYEILKIIYIIIISQNLEKFKTLTEFVKKERRDGNEAVL